MKTEQAIKLLHRLQDEQFDGPHGDERREALDMAVRALEQNLVQESDSLVKDLVKDCISRQAAIDAVKSYWKNEVDRIPKKSTDFDVFTQICDSILTHNANICKVIDKLPSAQPQRKKGKWFEVDPYMVICPFCKHASSRRNFCAECGADMRGESDD